MFAQTLMSFSLVPPANPLAIDPVCGATVRIASVPVSAIYRAVAYHFCSNCCHARFSRQPAKYGGVNAVPVP